MCLLSCLTRRTLFSVFFFFNDTATTEIYTLSLHDALPIFPNCALVRGSHRGAAENEPRCESKWSQLIGSPRSEEHTSELQSRSDLVCRLLLEKKKKKNTDRPHQVSRL